MTMQDQREVLAKELKERLERDLAELPAIVDATIKAIKDVPKHEEARLYVTTGPGHLRVDLPRTKSLVTEYLKLVIRQGFWIPEKAAFLWANEQENGDLYYHLTHENSKVTLAICFDAVIEGATCRLVHRGVKEVPVYEVVCDDPKEGSESDSDRE